MRLLLLLMALLVQVRQAWILPASSPLRAAPRSNAPAVTVAGSLGEGDAGMDSSVVRARLSKPIGLMLAEKEIAKPGPRVDDMVEVGSAEVVVLRGMTLVAACGVDCGIDVRPSCGDAPEHAAGGTNRFRFLDRGGGARGN
ncbi:unnamed protein product, partial [Ectocarpus sp. 12 AP-2014]